MKNNINKKVGATLLAAAIMAGTAVIPMSNAAVEAAAKEANKPSIQYRVQVQDHAWMSWVNEGEMAGTVGESRRMETLQVRMINCEGVSLKYYAHIQDLGDCYFTDKDEYVGTVAQSKRVEAIAITSEGLKEKGYQLQYRVQVQDYGWMPWVNDGEMAGTRYESKRLETIEIKVVPMDNENVDDELAAERAEALAEIARYNDIIPNVEGLTAYDKAMLNTRIATAIAGIESAKTAEEITDIKDKLVALIDNNYGLELAKAEAITEIKTYLEGASEGLKSYIEEKIKEINEVKVVEGSVTLEQAKTAIVATKGETTEECRAIITAQEYANEVFDIYSKAVDEAEGLLASEKTVIRSRISEDRTNVAKAESATDITGVNGIVKAFETYMKGDTRYAEIVKSAEKSIEKATAENELKNAINDAIADLEKYIEKTYKTDNDDKEGMKLAQEYKGEYIEILKASKNEEEVAEKLVKVKKELTDKVNDTKAYTEAYNIAINKLKDFERIIPTLEVTNANEITTYVQQTKSIVLEAKTATEIVNAMLRFEAYMDSFGIDFDAELSADGVKQAATTSKKKLNEYVNSNIQSVSTIAKEAIKEIDKIVESEETATEKVEAIEEKLNEAISGINDARLYDAQSKAYNKLVDYKDNKEYAEEVKEAATEGIEKIVAVKITNTVNVEKAIEEVNKELTKALDKISEVLGDIITDAKDAFNKAKSDILAELREYRNMATELGDSVAIRKVNQYIDVITDMTYEADFTIADLEAKKDVFESEMSSFEALTNKVTAIKDLQDAKIKETDYAGEKAQVNSVIDQAIADIKAVKAPAGTADEDVVDEEKKLIDKIVKTVTDLQEAYETFDATRTTEIGKLEDAKKVDTATVADQIEIDNKIAKIKALVLDLTAEGYGADKANEELNKILGK